MLLRKKAPSKAAELFRTTCTEMGLTDSCLALENMYLVGSGEISTPWGLVILTCSPLGVEKSVETAL